MTDRFEVGIEFHSVLAAISKQIYDTPLAFVRENVQNAVDAIRIQKRRSGATENEELSVSIAATPSSIEIRDNGVGMSRADQQNFFWTIGASGKRTTEAREAGCVGMFGIGGFANFGVCSQLSVTSQDAMSPTGYETVLSRAEIESTQIGIPQVSVSESSDASPRGTIVRGQMEHNIDVDQIESYLRGCVQYAQEPIYFNDELISGKSVRRNDSAGSGRIYPDDHHYNWRYGDITITGRLYETPAHVLNAELMSLTQGDQIVALDADLRFENGSIDVLKRGFKICSTMVTSQIGISGRLDCDRLFPTAGRDSLDAESQSLLASIAACIERVAVDFILQSEQRIAQHTRIFKYIRSNGLVEQIGKAEVTLADGRNLPLAWIREQAEGGAKIFHSTSHNRELAQLLQARGHIVVQLPHDRHKQRAVQDYLVSYCGAQAFDGRVECVESYDELTRFEKYFLSELEEAILGNYDVSAVSLIPGRLSEDIPVYAPQATVSGYRAFVDVRHPEITKLEVLGITELFRSMVAVFCREYLSTSLRRHSPMYFGNGAINLEFLAKRRSELWVLMTKDIETWTRGTRRDVVRQDDIRVVHAGVHANENIGEVNTRSGPPKLVRIDGTEEFADLFGYYLRMPNSASNAYGDIVQQCEDRAALWAGNKVVLFASDGVSAAFQFEVRLDRLILASDEVIGSSSGATHLVRDVQSLYDGLYFPIPTLLEDYLVPSVGRDVRIEVRCELTDYSTAKSWAGSDLSAAS